MKQSSFFSRTTLGQPNYLVIAMAAAFLVALVPGGARRAVDGLVSRPTDWLDASTGEAADLAWFDRHFAGQRTVVVSWNGCTLAETEKLSLLAKGLTLAAADKEQASWFERIITGPQALEELTSPPNNLSIHAAAERLEGSLVGPPRRGAVDNAAADQARTTCLMAVLTPAAAQDPATARAALNRIVDVAAAKCGVPRADLHLGGPLVESDGAATAATHALSGWALVVGLLTGFLAFVRLRHAAASAAIAAGGAIAGGVALAAVFYAGVVEVLALGRASPAWGVLTPLTATLPAVAFVVAVISAVRLFDGWRASHQTGEPGAVEAAIRNYWKPALAAAGFAALACLALEVSGLQPVREFGWFGAVSLVVGVGFVTPVMGVVLHRFPNRGAAASGLIRANSPGAIGAWVERFSGAMIRNPMPTLTVIGLVLGAAVAGMLQLHLDLGQRRLLSQGTLTARDRTWLDANLASQQQLEVVIAFPGERSRTEREAAEADGRQYRLSPAERAALVGELAGRLAKLSDVSSVLSPASTAEAGSDALPALIADERDAATGDPTGRELWRLSARLKLTADNGAANYDALHRKIQKAIDPLLVAAQQRDQVVRSLHERSSDLAAAKISILFRAPDAAAAPPEKSLEAALASLLVASGVPQQHLAYYNLIDYDKPGRSSLTRNRVHRQAVEEKLAALDAAVLVSAPSDPAARSLFAAGVPLVDVADLPSIEETMAAPFVDDGSPRPIRALFASSAAVESRVAKTASASIPMVALAFGGMLLAAMILVTKDVLGGLASTIAVALPAAIALGTLGWLRIGAGPGALAIGATAVALSLYAAIDYIACLWRGRYAGMDLCTANFAACRLMAKPWTDGAIICGAALAPLALCGFTPLAQFGASTLLLIAVSASTGLILLPAMVASPLGRFLDISPEDEVDAAPEQTPTLRPMPVPRPHFGEAPAAANGADHRRTDSGSDVAPRMYGRRRTDAEIDGGDDEQVASASHASLHAKLDELRRGARRELPGGRISAGDDAVADSA